MQCAGTLIVLTPGSPNLPGFLSEDASTVVPAAYLSPTCPTFETHKIHHSTQTLSPETFLSLSTKTLRYLFSTISRTLLCPDMGYASYLFTYLPTYSKTRKSDSWTPPNPKWGKLAVSHPFVPNTQQVFLRFQTPAIYEDLGFAIRACCAQLPTSLCDVELDESRYSTRECFSCEAYSKFSPDTSDGLGKRYVCSKSCPSSFPPPSL